jgi:hypothetical protein
LPWQNAHTASSAAGSGIEKLGLVIGLFCGWILSWNKLVDLLKDRVDLDRVTGMDIPPSRYHTLEVYADGETLRIPLDDVDSCVRDSCRICSDMTAEFSDLSVGSARLPEGWKTARSWNQVIVRTQRGMVTDGSGTDERNPGIPGGSARKPGEIEGGLHGKEGHSGQETGRSGQGGCSLSADAMTVSRRWQWGKALRRFDRARVVAVKNRLLAMPKQRIEGKASGGCRGSWTPDAASRIFLKSDAEAIVECPWMANTGMAPKSC